MFDRMFAWPELTRINAIAEIGNLWRGEALRPTLKLYITFNKMRLIHFGGRFGPMLKKLTG